MRIDAHHHLWRYEPAAYPWIEPDMPVLRRDFLPADLAETVRPAGINATIAVQARQTVEETRWLLSLARAEPLIRGVVGWLPLADESIEAVLDDLVAYPRLRGVRHVVQAEPDPNFLENTAFNRGVAAAGRRGLAYDLLIYARQLPGARAFVDRHPNVPIVIDHLAKPLVAGEPPQGWRRDLREIAKRPHVVCKFSGLITEAPGCACTPETARRFFESALECFGPRRLMFGSDWPVCLLGISYQQWVTLVEGCTAALSQDEQARFWGGAATEVYQLGKAIA